MGREEGERKGGEGESEGGREEVSSNTKWKTTCLLSFTFSDQQLRRKLLERKE